LALGVTASFIFFKIFNNLVWFLFGFILSAIYLATQTRNFSKLIIKNLDAEFVTLHILSPFQKILARIYFEEFLSVNDMAISGISKAYPLAFKKTHIYVNEEKVDLFFQGIDNLGYYIYYTNAIPTLFGLSNTKVFTNSGCVVSSISSMFSNESMNLRHFTPSSSKFDTYIRVLPTGFINTQHKYELNHHYDLTMDKFPFRKPIISEEVLKKFDILQFIDTDKIAQIFDQLDDLAFLEMNHPWILNPITNFIFSLIPLGQLIQWSFVIFPILMFYYSHSFRKDNEHNYSFLWWSSGSLSLLFGCVISASRTSISFFLFIGYLVATSAMILVNFINTQRKKDPKHVPNFSDFISLSIKEIADTFVYFVVILLIGKILEIPFFVEIFDLAFSTIKMSVVEFSDKYKDTIGNFSITSTLVKLSPKSDGVTPVDVFRSTTNLLSGIFSYFKNNDPKHIISDFLSLFSQFPYWMHNQWSLFVGVFYVFNYQRHRGCVKAVDALTKDNWKFIGLLTFLHGPVPDPIQYIKIGVSLSLVPFTSSGLLTIVGAFFLSNFCFIGISYLTSLSYSSHLKTAPNTLALNKAAEADAFIHRSDSIVFFAFVSSIVSSLSAALITKNYFIAIIIVFRAATIAQQTGNWEILNSFIFMICQFPTFVLLIIMEMGPLSIITRVSVTKLIPFNFLGKLNSFGRSSTNAPATDN